MKLCALLILVFLNGVSCIEESSDEDEPDIEETNRDVPSYVVTDEKLEQVEIEIISGNKKLSELSNLKKKIISYTYIRSKVYLPYMLSGIFPKCLVWCSC